MNGELSLKQNGIIGFAVKRKKDEVSDIKSVKIEETSIEETKIIEKEGRFARLKRTLRKRSASIL